MIFLFLLRIIKKRAEKIFGSLLLFSSYELPPSIFFQFESFHIIFDTKNLLFYLCKTSLIKTPQFQRVKTNTFIVHNSCFLINDITKLNIIRTERITRKLKITIRKKYIKNYKYLTGLLSNLLNFLGENR